MGKTLIALLHKMLPQTKLLRGLTLTAVAGAAVVIGVASIISGAASILAIIALALGAHYLWRKWNGGDGSGEVVPVPKEGGP